ncbi:AbrB/MazE/SpoVT family DNA-binding domain-containing protein [Endozoicomonas sp. SM1973]|uniref:AbrB/MazE/SpoVT family DNA-binding domain-containing protein n=1 Tax=Spartinivicinus marinus TaxID=2994442 RepID=A0A853I9M1_9GAMM|nr:AbrB/MazE/SpoVT family DNA-binding domain-containing protein [Spartinivicinus marinus]MCX4024723.1 AbrB/MazE/SpoVT family DNA-binding domain-containing protein [Spartinivicinus marinus]NYZ66247.1 AbrB/MazE/SpoVT family DNA-binding domain-containing protein [Spartinivicinus marinus]
MSTATITSKGQVTIPKEVREALALNTGDRIEFIQINNERFEIVAVNKDVTALKGLIKKPKKPVSIEEMNEAIAAQGDECSD